MPATAPKRRVISSIIKVPDLLDPHNVIINIYHSIKHSDVGNYSHWQAGGMHRHAYKTFCDSPGVMTRLACTVLPTYHNKVIAG